MALQVGLKDSTCYAFECSGLIEDSSQVWTHPPRHGIYDNIVETIPFPKIKFPLQIGNNLASELFWVANRTKEINGTYTRTYSNLGIEQINTDFGKLTVNKILLESAKKDNSEISAFANTYFNEKYGFVKWEGISVTKTYFCMTLIKVTNE